MSETSIRSNLKLKIAVVSLLITSIGFGAAFAITEDSRMRISNDYRHYLYLYNQAYENYIETQADLDATEAVLLLAEADLLEAQETLALIEDNTGFAGEFYILSQYNQNYGTGVNVISMNKSYTEYFYYRNDMEHPSHASENLLTIAQIIASYCRPASVQTLAEFIQSNVDYPSNDECVLDGLLSYCQDRGDFESCIHYRPDQSEDFAKYPIETLVESCGDCEDKAILFASMARALDYDVKIAVITGHAFVLVHMDSAPSHNSQSPTHYHYDISSVRYYPCETTNYGWRIGDLPPESQGESVYTYAVA